MTMINDTLWQMTMTVTVAVTVAVTVTIIIIDDLYRTVTATEHVYRTDYILQQSTGRCHALSQ